MDAGINPFLPALTENCPSCLQCKKNFASTYGVPLRVYFSHLVPDFESRSDTSAATASVLFVPVAARHKSDVLTIDNELCALTMRAESVGRT